MPVHAWKESGSGAIASRKNSKEGPDMERILIAEDDESVRIELAALVAARGYLPVYDTPCDLALLDVNLPGESGFILCRRLRAEHNVPVILLTARVSTEDELAGFGAGADDYVRKPYNPEVLMARIERLLHKPRKAVTVRELTLDESTFSLYFRGESVSLTKNEVRIMYCLMKKETCPKDEIIEELWTNGCYIDENALYVNIARLREKLRTLGADGYLHTVRGVGYRL